MTRTRSQIRKRKNRQPSDPKSNRSKRTVKRIQKNKSLKSIVDKGVKWFQGVRGGWYYLTSNGNKKYAPLPLSAHTTLKAREKKKSDRARKNTSVQPKDSPPIHIPSNPSVVRRVVAQNKQTRTKAIPKPRRSKPIPKKPSPKKPSPKKNVKSPLKSRSQSRCNLFTKWGSVCRNENDPITLDALDEISIPQLIANGSDYILILHPSGKAIQKCVRRDTLVQAMESQNMYAFDPITENANRRVRYYKEFVNGLWCNEKSLKNIKHGLGWTVYVIKKIGEDRLSAYFKNDQDDRSSRLHGAFEDQIFQLTPVMSTKQFMASIQNSCDPDIDIVEKTLAYARSHPDPTGQNVVTSKVTKEATKILKQTIKDQKEKSRK